MSRFLASRMTVFMCTVGSCWMRCRMTVRDSATRWPSWLDICCSRSRRHRADALFSFCAQRPIARTLSRTSSMFEARVKCSSSLRIISFICGSQCGKRRVMISNFSRETSAGSVAWTKKWLIYSTKGSGRIRQTATILYIVICRMSSGLRSRATRGPTAESMYSGVPR